MPHGHASKVDFLGAMKTLLEARIARVNTCLPGNIVSFDKEKLTVSVRPGVDYLTQEGEVMRLPTLVDVPFVFPGSGHYVMTYPVLPGDECLLFFSQRAMDAWWALGDAQKPSHTRLHDFSDAFAMGGVCSQAKLIPDVASDALEIRARDGAQVIRMQESGAVEIMSSRISLVDKDKNIRLVMDEKGGITVTVKEMRVDGDLHITGEVMAREVKTQTGIALSTHIHGGVEPGAGVTTQPTSA